MKRRWITKALMQPIKFYQYFISPSLGQNCRYTPSCSAYALQALEKHGALAGTYLAAKRVVCCNPLCQGGHDPVPDQTPRYFSFCSTNSTSSNASSS